MLPAYKVPLLFFVALPLGVAFANGDGIPPCSLNGNLLANGTCECLPNSGWGGAACRTLQLQPAAPLTVESQAYFHPANGGGSWFDNSWGISVLPDDDAPGLWHGFMTELEGNCSLSSYGAASRILHVTAPSPMGPFTVQGVALNAFAHNPQVLRDVDGAWLLFHIGHEITPACNIHCVDNKPVSNASCAGGHGTSVARATSPWGPWERVPYILPDNQTNPSAVVLKNGTILVTARRWTGGVPIYVAQSWRGPYAMQPLAPVVAVPALVAGVPAVDPSFDEDPYLWVNELGTYHMLTHRQPNGTNCSPTAHDAFDCRCAGGHMFATDPIAGPWYYDLALVYNCTLLVAGQPAPLSLHARQRPTLLFPGSSGGGCPLLFTGASSDPVSQYYSSFTMVQQVAC